MDELIHACGEHAAVATWVATGVHNECITLLMIAAMYGLHTLVSQLLRCNPDQQVMVTNSDGRTASVLAAVAGHWHILKLLLGYKCSEQVSALSDGGKELLSLAVSGNALMVVSTLLGAHSFPPDILSHALEQATVDGNENMILLLVRARASCMTNNKEHQDKINQVLSKHLPDPTVSPLMSFVNHVGRGLLSGMKRVRESGTPASPTPQKKTK